MARQKKHFLGIDPGKNGGMAVITVDGTPCIWTRMPQGVGLIVDWIAAAARQYPRLVMVTEKAQAMPKQGIASAFRYGQHFGIFEASSAMLKLPYHEVSPVVWKKAMGLTSSKSLSSSVCRRIFPQVELVLSGCRKDHDGIAEALLVAEWTRRRQI